MARLDDNGLGKLWEFVKKRTPVVVQTTGGSERAVMSQKATTEAVGIVVLPDYYTDYFAEKIASVKALQEEAGANASAFVVFSDSHDMASQPYAAPIAKKVMEECRIEHAFYLGDAAGYSLADETSAKESLDRTLAKFKAIKDTLLVAGGNHDGAYGPTDEFLIPKNSLYAHYFSFNKGKADNFGDGSTYCFVDDAAEKTRYIILNSYDVPDITDAPKMGVIRQSQYDWLYKALNVEDGWHVACFCHYPPVNEYAMESPGFGYLDDVLVAYKNKTTFTANYDGIFGDGGGYTNLYDKNGDGFVNNSKLDGAESSAAGCFVTNKIYPAFFDVVHVKADAVPYKVRLKYSRIDGAGTQGGSDSYWANVAPVVSDYDSSVYTFIAGTVNADGSMINTTDFKLDYIQFEFRAGSPDNVIVTINQNIEGEAGGAKWDALNLNYDFSAYNGDLIGIFAGHLHTDLTWNALNSPYKCFIQTVCCDARGLDDRSYNDITQYPEFGGRAVGTIYEQCLDVVVVDRSTKKVNSVRIGAGYDRTNTY